MANVSGSPEESIVLKEEQMKKAFSLSSKAHKSPDKLYLVEKIRSNNRSSSSEVIISFSGFGSVKDWFSETPFGETKINLNLFPSLKSVGNNEVALVNKAFLNRFEAVLGKSSFVAEVDQAMTKHKQIVFTGHSSGAAVAILATLWALDKYITPNTNRIPPLCVTFGSPLVGNHIFSHATRREKWSAYFTHFVMKYDIVPRLLLAPLSSFEQRFDPVLQFFNPKSKYFMDESIGNYSVTSEFYMAVMTNAAKTTSHAACKLMGSKNAMPDMLANFITLSPYRPFGTYIFCTGKGQMIGIRNPHAALQLLFFSAQVSTKAEAAHIAYKCLKEHVIYDDELKESLAMQNVVWLDQIEKLPLSADESDGNIAAINMALNDLGLTLRARMCLRAAGELEKQKARNEEKFDKKKFMRCLKEVEEYKANKTKRVEDVDTSKMENYRNDFQSGVLNGFEMASVWDEIIEMLRRYELPDEFESKPEWIELGTKYRRLVEPSEIAKFYHYGKNLDSGPYMGKGRPKRHRYTQRWQEHAEKKAEGACSETCFWAEVEEFRIRTRNYTSFEDVKEEVLKVEREIKRLSDEGVITKDVFVESSTFVKWWKSLPHYHKEGSCIRNFINV
ncbi:protein EDS1L-like [Senna tora]|uniref:Protein EDS1L-like n=1 Tax=Senna tora TaxID=362788 RepID=A0A834SZ59_9FABA|nr:protein EDS1L-like [Senna tora]